MKNLLFATFVMVSWSCSGVVFAQTTSFESAVLSLVEDVKVASLDAGVVKSLQVKPGDQISAGDVLIRLDTDLYQAEANANRSALSIAQLESSNDVNLRFAKKTRALNEKQLEKSLRAVQQYAKSISETEIDRLKLERDQAELSIEQAELEQKINNENIELRRQQFLASDVRLKRRTLKAPLSGTVLEVIPKQGEAVTAGQPVVRIVNLARLRVKALIDTEHVFQINKSSKAYFEIKLDGTTSRIPATIVFVSPEVRPTSKKFEVWADLKNDDNKLLPGFKGRLVVEL